MEQMSTVKDEVKAGGEGPAPEYFQYIVIRLGNEQYGIDISYIDNIVRMQNITRVPKVPAYLKGVINLRGEIIPVVSLRLKMGLETDEVTRATRIIIIKSETEGSFGVMVDEVREVVTLSSDNIDKVTHNAKDGVSYINGIGKKDGELISLLDLNLVTLGDNA